MPRTETTPEFQYQITKDWIDRLVDQETAALTMRLSDLRQIQAALNACPSVFNCGECKP